jgi:hypothetical protein
MNNERKTTSATPARISPQLQIFGRVTTPLSLPIETLRTMDHLETDSLLMICGSGEPKGHLGNCRGVLLADIINQAEVLVKEHNDTKKMFVVAASDDGYKAVFSWQEIFNSPNGDSILVVLEKNGRPLHDGCGEVDLLSARDHLIGPRYVRQLKTVEIVMVE